MNQSEHEYENSLLVNIEAEQAIIGCILFDIKALKLAIEELPIQAFSYSNHRLIYKACLDVYASTKSCDLPTVSNFLIEKNLLDTIGGMSAISRLLCSTVSPVNVDRYIKIVMKKYKRRTLQELGNKLIKLAVNPEYEVKDLYSEVSSLIDDWVAEEDEDKNWDFSVAVTYTYGDSKTETGRSEQLELSSMSNSIDDVERITDLLRAKAIKALSNKPRSED